MKSEISHFEVQIALEIYWAVEVAWEYRYSLSMKLVIFPCVLIISK
jgi:hypothetical protein